MMKNTIVKKISESLADIQCMNKWNEESWNQIPLDTEGSLSQLIEEFI